MNISTLVLNGGIPIVGKRLVTSVECEGAPGDGRSREVVEEVEA